MAGPRQTNVNRSTPAAYRAKLGDVVSDLINEVNALKAKVNTLTAKLDADAGVTDTNYTALVAVSATPIVDLESR